MENPHRKQQENSERRGDYQKSRGKRATKESSEFSDGSYPKRQQRVQNAYVGVSEQEGRIGRYRRMNDLLSTLVDTPFTDEISLIDPPAHFNPPKFTFYDGTADPEDHIIHYRQAMIPTSIPN